MARFAIDQKELDRLFQVLKEYPGDAESAINDVFYNDVPKLVEPAIRRLVPVSGRTWNGKKRGAKAAANSIRERPKERKNLSVVIGTTRDYHYLYFPDDGSNTRRHAGEQQFFKRGGESQQSEIIDRCINKMVEKLFEN